MKEKCKTDEGLWKLTPRGNPHKTRIPPRLAKAAHTTLGFFTVSTSPTAAIIYF
jgi:hypothetical protein